MPNLQDPIRSKSSNPFIRLLDDEEFQRALEDADLTSLRPHIALVDRLIEPVAMRALDGDGCPNCAEAATLYDVASASTTDRQRANAALKRIRELLNHGRMVQTSKQELIRLQDHRARLTEVENRREIAQETVVTERQLNLILGALVMAARDSISDPAVQRRFVGQLALIYDRLRARRAPAQAIAQDVTAEQTASSDNGPTGDPARSA